MARFRPTAPWFGALAAMALWFAGCASPANPGGTSSPSPLTPPPPAPAPATAKPAPVVVVPVVVPAPPPPKPAPVVEARPASITGSEETSTMFDNFTAYVAAIDDAPVAAGRAGWQTPLRLKAGPRTLTVAFVRGVFTAHADVRIRARSGAAYELKFGTDAQVFGKSSYCEFWIVDTATGEKVLAPTRAPLIKIEQAK